MTILNTEQSCESYTEKHDESLHLAYTPLRVLRDVLIENGAEIINSPKDEEHIFAWFELSYGLSTCPQPCDVSSILQNVDVPQCLTYLTKNPNGYVFLCEDEPMLPDSLYAFRNQILFARSTKTNATTLIQLLYLLFLRSMALENKIQGMLTNKAPLLSILNAGAIFFRSHICITDTSHNVVLSCTNDLSLPMNYTSILTQVFCYETTFAMRKRFNPSSTEKCPLYKTNTDNCLILQYPLRSNTGFLGYLTLIKEKDDAPHPSGIEIPFLRYAQNVANLVLHTNENDNTLNPKQDSLLILLLEGLSVSEEAFALNKYQIQLPANDFFRIIAIDISNTQKLNVEKLKYALSKINKGKSRVVGLKDHLVCIAHSKTSISGPLSTRAIMNELDKEIIKPFGITCGLSSLFRGVSNLHFGYEQATYALEYRDIVAREVLTYSICSTNDVVLFEAAFPYLCSNASLQGDTKKLLEMMDFFAQQAITIPRKLFEEDIENNTNNFVLLWYYIAFEGSTALASRKLFMHRNTFLYRIRLIEERFNLDLTDSFFRECLKTEYRCVLSQLDDNEYQQLFKNKETQKDGKES